MSHEQFDKLREWIVALIAEAASHDTSDGGLIESVRLSEIEREARALFVTPED